MGAAGNPFPLTFTGRVRPPTRELAPANSRRRGRAGEVAPARSRQRVEEPGPAQAEERRDRRRRPSNATQTGSGRETTEPQQRPRPALKPRNDGTTDGTAATGPD